MARTKHTREEALGKLQTMANGENLAGMSRFGIDTQKALGISMPNIRAVGKEITKDHDLAQELWDSDIHEARILASIIDDAKWVTSQQMEDWVKDFNSWDLCDQVCGNLFERTSLAHEKILSWANREQEFVKRAAFAMIAWRAVHDKKQDDEFFFHYLPMIETASDDPRNFVKKAVNWALRQIGKRSRKTHGPALALAEKLAKSANTARRWVGNDAVKELRNPKLLQRLGI